MWDFVGMARTKESLQKALTGIEEVKKDFWTNVRIPGDVNELNVELEKALRLIDFIEVGMLMARDGLNREESCGVTMDLMFRVSGKATMFRSSSTMTSLYSRFALAKRFVSMRRMDSE